MLRRLNFDMGDRVTIQGREYAFDGEVVTEGAALDAPRALTFRDARTAAPVTHRARPIRRPLRGRRGSRVARLRTGLPSASVDRQSPPTRGSCVGDGSGARPSTQTHAPDRTRLCASSSRGRCLMLADTGRPPPSPGSLRVWLRERGAPGDRRSRFMSDRRGCDGAPLRLEPVAQRVLSEKAEVFFDGVRTNPQAIYFATRAAVDRDQCHSSRRWLAGDQSAQREHGAPLPAPPHRLRPGDAPLWLARGRPPVRADKRLDGSPAHPGHRNYRPDADRLRGDRRRAHDQRRAALARDDDRRAIALSARLLPQLRAPERGDSTGLRAPRGAA